MVPLTSPVTSGGVFSSRTPHSRSISVVTADSLLLEEHSPIQTTPIRTNKP